MTDTNQQPIETFDAGAEPRNERREFFKTALGAAAVAGAGVAAVSIGGYASAEAGANEKDFLNFALNLEYLEAQFYSYAVSGAGLSNADLTGTGTQGAVTGGAQVNFTDPVVARFAREIAQDKLNHVRYLRSLLGTAAIAQPAIDLGVTATSAFSNAARLASLVGAGQGFDVYANDQNFLLGAFIFEDVGVTAYKGGSIILTDPGYLAAVAGIIAVRAYHASILRSTLYAKGATTASLRTSADAISGARDTLDGTADLDQGISPTGTGAAIQSNVTPLDGNGLAYSRTTNQVMKILYLTSAAASGGGFFPAGLNGTIRNTTV
ncbi:ferritin-like domain-containing protein [Sphingomonas alpina]|uniref:Ferritin-like domain-containing protein n=1 Tax=Sphingomonas alpina TaxID=653931 RepID=A0A7H0LHK4_9SPHN|nr:ferritin-like domain-containing protein [Sphingomonas alpina]QNQ09157.1 ferritin-like domain-containing protein [Sphingomonas alpina]